MVRRIDFFMITYLPTQQHFLTRLEAKLELGTANFNRLLRENPDHFLFEPNSSATHEYLHSNTRTT